MNELNISEIKQIQMNLLVFFDEFCSENKLRYSLAGGTLLGAIRHKGYIPWDDDIDVMMPRPDFERMKTLQIPKEFEFSFPNKQTKAPYIYTYGKLYDLSTELIEFPNSKHVVSHVYIDIFPIDGIPEDKTAHQQLYKKIQRLCLFNHCLERSFYNKDCASNMIKKIVWSIVWWFRNILPRRFAILCAEKILLTYDFDSCKRVGSMVAGYGPKENFSRASFDIMNAEFEHYSLNVIKGYDEYLSALYGDYMQLPPEEKRVASHDYIAYSL